MNRRWLPWVLLAVALSWALVATAALVLATYYAPVAHWFMLMDAMLLEVLSPE